MKFTYFGIGAYPVEYNRRIHGPYDQARFYGKPDTPFGQVKIWELPAWLSRSLNPVAMSRAVSRVRVRVRIDSMLHCTYRNPGRRITSPLIRKCNSVFRRFLRIRGCTWALNDAFIVLSEWKSVENNCNHCLLSTYRHQMAHFMHTSPRRTLETIRDSVAIFFTEVHNLCIDDKYQAKNYAGESSFDSLQKTFHLFQHCVRQIHVGDQSVPMVFDAASFLVQMDFSGYLVPISKVHEKSKHIL
ncbi:hypothetical protein BV898_18173 [Hypsibius exemplaris]|uniref:Uncharacterized protein n=1 Tax=Hypsibius exemplaris TaxID=2072580 RepID=A0A9X6RNK6_HYPEX|nr:hypothetical protein BV898_18173 [Hypsibius exemplaris]